MIIWSVLLVPIISSLILLVVWKHRLVWWEILLPLTFSSLLIFISKATIDWVNTTSTEYLTGYVTAVKYFEDWNERVSCRHPKYCTRRVSYTYSCGSAKSPRTCSGTRSESYQCGYQHAYDVDYHSEYWEADTNIGRSPYISKAYFDAKVKLWNNKQFKDLHRSYHTNDGDMYYSTFDGLDEHLDEMSFAHHYTNRIKNSNNVFNFKPVSEKDFQTYGLYNYPEIDSNNNQIAVLGYNNPETNHWMKVLNARLGADKQVKLFILVYKNKGIISSIKQEDYWKGSNQNEVVLTIGINDANEIQWVKTFSWSTNHSVKTDLTSYILEDKVLNLNKDKILGMKEIINQTFKRRDFREFDYITIEPSNFALAVTFLLTLALNLVIGYIVVKNDINYNSKTETFLYTRRSF